MRNTLVGYDGEVPPPIPLTDDVDEAASDDSPLASDDVCDITSDDGAEEGAGGEDGGDERQVAAAKSFGTGSFDEVDEDLRAGDTVDVTRVVSEEDTTERGESADEVGLEGDWRFNAVDVARGGEVAQSRHGVLVVSRRTVSGVVCVLVRVGSRCDGREEWKQ